ncbi:hypothetical protein L204_101722 [Cryptococcus depauperatus]
MPPSFLRKKQPRQQQNSRQQPAKKPIRHSLSLPDLTTPLLDPNSWEEVPPFHFGHGTGTGTESQRGIRNYKPSFIGQDAQFHRPFTPRQVASPGSIWTDGDFRHSSARWEEVRAGNATDGANASVRQSMVSVVSRRKTRKKGAAERLNVVVAGGKGVGKTSFINHLLSSLSEAEDSHPTPNPRPTTLPQSHVALSTLADRLLLRLVDTPGLELSSDDGVGAKERERGVIGLLRIVEDRFECTLREERKVRRQVGAEEGLVHLVIYLIDARQVLRPEEAQRSDNVDWSCVGLFDDEDVTPPVDIDVGASKIGPRLSTIELEIIRRLSKRANVIAVLARTDSLTITELESVKTAVQRDLADAFDQIPGKGFGVFYSSDENCLQTDSIKEEDEMDVDQERDPRPPTPDSIHTSTSFPTLSNLPYSIFVPEPSSTTRHYPWGEASALNELHSDFMLLREAILVEYTKILRNRTREVLYENYRTERLLKQAGK